MPVFTVAKRWRERAGGMSGANWNQYNSYHHLQVLLMASPQAVNGRYSHLHLGSQHLSVYMTRLLPIITASAALSSDRATSTHYTKKPTSIM